MTAVSADDVMVEQLRREGRTVLVHCVQAHHAEIGVGGLEGEHGNTGPTNAGDLPHQSEACEAACRLMALASQVARGCCDITPSIRAARRRSLRTPAAST